MKYVITSNVKKLAAKYGKRVGRGFLLNLDIIIEDAVKSGCNLHNGGRLTLTGDLFPFVKRTKLAEPKQAIEKDLDKAMDVNPCPECKHYIGNNCRCNDTCMFTGYAANFFERKPKGKAGGGEVKRSTEILSSDEVNAELGDRIIGEGEDG